MESNFTTQHLIKHLYNETSASEAAAIQNALANDEFLREEFDRLQEVKQALDESGGEEPGAKTIQMILEYSSQQQMEIV